MNIKIDKKILFIILFIIGVIYRLWLITLIPQPLLIGDQFDYHRYGVAIAEKGLFALAPRLYGYPLFLGVIYKIFGVNTGEVIFFQAVLDTFTGIIIYLIARRIFKKLTPAWIAFLLYLFNPFTANFVGLILTEVLATFLMALVLYLLLRFSDKKDRKSVVILGLLLGYLPQVRPPYFFFTIAVLLGVIFFVFRNFLLSIRACFKSPYSVITAPIRLQTIHRSSLYHFGYSSSRFMVFARIWTLLSRKRLLKQALRKKIILSCLYGFFYILPFSYTVLGNMVYFKEFNFLTVDNIMVRELYISLYVGRSPAHDTKLILSPPLYMFPEEVKQIYNEYTILPKNKEERQKMAEKYLNLAIGEIKRDPGKFVISHIQKMWYVWEKHFIFYYFQPANRFADFTIYWGNVLLLILAFAGVLFWTGKELKTNKDNIKSCFGILVILLFVYTSILHSFSLSEERYSLPAYTMVFLFSGYSIWSAVVKTNSDNRRD